MSTWHVSNEVRNKIASTGPLGQAWLDELARDTPGDVDGHPAMTADVEEVEVVVAHQERITLRVGDVFVKLDADRSRLDVEVEAMTMPPVPTPEILWRKRHELALAALPGTALGRLGQPSPASPAAWAAAGAAVRTLHDAPLPPWRSRKLDGLASQLDIECEWFVANEVLPADVVTHNRRLAERALRPSTPVFMHGDLQVCHVFVDGDEVTGILDWSEGGQGDALWDLAVLTMGTPSTSATSSPATAPTSTSTWSAGGGRCVACWRPAGWSSTATVRPRSIPRSPC